MPKSLDSACELQDAECLYWTALAHESECRESCVDLFLQVARATCHHDQHDCAGCRKCQLHDSAMFKLVVAGQRFGRLDPRQGLVVRWNGREHSVPISHHGFVWDPSEFDFLTPVGKYKTNALRRIHRSPGVGVPLVVTSCDRGAHPFIQGSSYFTATLRMRTDDHGPDSTERSDHATLGCRLELHDSLRVREVMVADQRRPLARDISAAMAYRLRDESQTIIIDNFINPGGANSKNRLFTVEPYQPGKVPVVFVHGLLSDPFTWVEMVNELRAYPGFADRYQVWGFEYPTGQSFLESAARLREQLEVAAHTFDPAQQDPQLHNMVLVGHSMGGLIAKLQITSSGEQLWNAVANRPLSQIAIPEQYRVRIEREFYFRPCPHVSRAVFMATPHRGASSAARLIGRISSSLVNLPQADREAHERVIRCNPGVFSEEVSRRIPTSLDLLEPGSPLLRAIASLPVSEHVQMHSVIGDRCRTLHDGRSDGVVSVNSAREARAQTERRIKATHTRVNEHPEAIEELICILCEHLMQSQQPLIRTVNADRASETELTVTRPTMRHALGRSWPAE